jgi:predicted DNA-binding transcriptional regulator YafY
MNKKNAEEKVRVNRVLMIDDAIRSGRYPNATDLAAKAEVTVRTIWRDIDYLRNMYEAPIEYDSSKRGYYYTEENFFIKGVMLTEGELFSIALFDRLLMQYRNTPLEKDLREIFKKIVQSIPEKITVQPDFLMPKVTFMSGKAPDIDADIFTALFTALKHSVTIRFDYRPLSKTTYIQFTVDPYHAVYNHGSWYLIGYCHYNKMPLIFSFARMRKLIVTKDTFKIPRDFNPNEYTGDPIGVWASARTSYTVELLYDSSIGTFALEDYWNDTQEVIQNKDGTVYVEFTTTQIPAVLYRVLGQGSAITVLNPSELIDIVKEEVEKLREKYAGKGATEYNHKGGEGEKGKLRK